MTKILIEGSRTVDSEDHDTEPTIGGVANSIAIGIHGEKETVDRQFSLKVGGTLFHPDTPTNDVALTSGEHTVELVEVTGQQWPEPDTDDTALEVGVPHDAAGILRVQVPSGNVDDLIAWAGDDVERGQAVIDVEVLQEHPRVTLIERLCAHLNLPDPLDVDDDITS